MRAVAVVTCIVALVGFALWLFGPKSAGTFGLTFGAGTRPAVLSIDETSPYKHDGVRAGDVIRFDLMPLSQRLNLTEAVTGIGATVAFERSGSISTFTEVAQPAPAAPLARQIVIWILTLLYAAMTVLIAWRAPRGRLRTIIMLVVAPLAISSAGPSIEKLVHSPLALAVLDFLFALGIPTFIVSGFMFIVNFPPRSTPALRAVRFVGFPLTLAISVIFFFTFSVNFAFRVLPDPFDWGHLFDYLTLLAFGTWIVGIIDGVIAAEEGYRTAALVAGSTLFVLSVINIALSLTSLFGWNASWERSLQWLQWASGFGVSYAVLRHKLLDLNVVVSRAAIFSVVSLSLIAIFVLAEWVLATVFERAIGPDFGENGKTTLTAVVALCVGLSARGVHYVVEHRLNRVFFAKRYRALADLHRFALETDVATDSSALLELTINALRRNLGSEYVALYTGTPDSGYVAAGTSATSRLPLRLDQDEEVVLRLRRWGEPFVVESESHPIVGAYVSPMMLRGALYGFAICGPKQDHSGYVPDEREVVASLTHRVGIAYEWLTRGVAPPVTR